MSASSAERQNACAHVMRRLPRVFVYIRPPEMDRDLRQGINSILPLYVLSADVSREKERLRLVRPIKNSPAMRQAFAA